MRKEEIENHIKIIQKINQINNIADEIKVEMMDELKRNVKTKIEVILIVNNEKKTIYKTRDIK